ncbi:CDK-activating kinase assembly factor MAT1 isoform X2 [Canis lupus baileyi]|uniref:CDK-activating kinase assembly factor MAT1 n=1 Tax=Canis lupus familiaris TaxID=9615 RepID=A0A8C0RX76_CANLF|nr:CDK-activating kinase assembly factor MAT1 isoform X2 [Canis lupus familiaris]XP_025300078.1 CDK-activating kinase assembly factor MAT1 isoform X2 [Canis lupus dingo]XP_038400802.1 CDK-activating kinase assembly factor MAT1 isoform X2 [Canis lupus familiaris]XP_038529719.1 CDK-activating kinase assembly factor MAT1 isoform X2 [Canis lupus familiaris]|eukprot:XP_022277793.1 CDK-activating kinase assembly factor MAT1 isoform X2 [Canis lupus familiaris]
MDDQGCPRCKTTKYRNPSLKLMVNVCGHTLCESCVDLLFMRGAGNCPECGTPLRKSNFRVQLFEDPTVDKEVEIRKKVLKIYNKREEDFPSLREYNDFLEEVEEIVFNLTNNVDLDNTKKKMEMYQKENKDVIQKNKLKLTREQEELEEALEVERQENEQRRLFIQKEEQLQQILKRKNKQAFLDELESSDLPVALLLAQHKDRSTQLEMQLEKPKPIKPVTFSTGIKMGQHISLAPIQKLEEALYEYQPLHIETCGPQVPDLEMLGRLGEAQEEKSEKDRDCIILLPESLCSCHFLLIHHHHLPQLLGWIKVFKSCQSCLSTGPCWRLYFFSCLSQSTTGCIQWAFLAAQLTFISPF